MNDKLLAVNAAINEVTEEDDLFRVLDWMMDICKHLNPDRYCNIMEN